MKETYERQFNIRQWCRHGGCGLCLLETILEIIKVLIFIALLEVIEVITFIIVILLLLPIVFFFFFFFPILFRIGCRIVIRIVTRHSGRKILSIGWTGFFSILAAATYMKATRNNGQQSSIS